MKPLAQHITEGLKNEETLIVEKQEETTTVAETEAPQSILDIANIAPEKEEA